MAFGREASWGVDVHWVVGPSHIESVKQPLFRKHPSVVADLVLRESLNLHLLRRARGWPRFDLAQNLAVELHVTFHAAPRTTAPVVRRRPPAPAVGELETAGSEGSGDRAATRQGAAVPGQPSPGRGRHRAGLEPVDGPPSSPPSSSVAAFKLGQQVALVGVYHRPNSTSPRRTRPRVRRPAEACPAGSAGPWVDVWMPRGEAVVDSRAAPAAHEPWPPTRRSPRRLPQALTRPRHAAVSKTGPDGMRVRIAAIWW